jgi:hypothetical protein
MLQSSRAVRHIPLPPRRRPAIQKPKRRIGHTSSHKNSLTSPPMESTGIPESKQLPVLPASLRRHLPRLHPGQRRHYHFPFRGRGPQKRPTKKVEVGERKGARRLELPPAAAHRPREIRGDVSPFAHATRATPNCTFTSADVIGADVRRGRCRNGAEFARGASSSALT